MHTVILLGNPVGTRFVALGRHRFGSGIFHDIATVKELDWTTLNLVTDGGRRSAHESVPIDLDRLDEILEETRGFEKDPQLLPEAVLVGPSERATYENIISRFRGKPTSDENLLRAMLRDSNSPRAEVTRLAQLIYQG